MKCWGFKNKKTTTRPNLDMEGRYLNKRRNVYDMGRILALKYSKNEQTLSTWMYAAHLAPVHPVSIYHSLSCMYVAVQA